MDAPEGPVLDCLSIFSVITLVSNCLLCLCVRAAVSEVRLHTVSHKLCICVGQPRQKKDAGVCVSVHIASRPLLRMSFPVVKRKFLSSIYLYIIKVSVFYFSSALRMA